RIGAPMGVLRSGLHDPFDCNRFVTAAAPGTPKTSQRRRGSETQKPLKTPWLAAVRTRRLRQGARGPSARCPLCRPSWVYCGVAMALVPCSACGQLISEESLSCPLCRAAREPIVASQLEKPARTAPRRLFCCTAWRAGRFDVRLRPCAVAG